MKPFQQQPRAQYARYDFTTAQHAAHEEDPFADPQDAHIQAVYDTNEGASYSD